MEPSVMDINEIDGVYKFTISSINVSYANAIRRVILSDIPTVVIRTFPYEKNTANFEINTSSLNNEILKQRLSCIPIFIKDLGTELDDYIIEVDKNNTGDEIIYVTTADFKIKNIKTGKYLSDESLKQIFPPNPISNRFIDFCRLKPQYSEDFKGEHLKFTAKLSIGTAIENGSFNVVSTCAYANTPDVYAISQAKEQKMIELQAKYETDEEVQYNIKDWETLDAKRIFIPDSFDFKIKTLGVYTNTEIVVKAIDIIIYKLRETKEKFSTVNDLINPSDNTGQNLFDISLKDEDYTIGKIIEYSLYELYYLGDKSLTFCGFSKPHPHLSESIIRVGFREETDKSSIVVYLNNAIDNAIKYFTKLYPHFGKITPEEQIAIESSIPQSSIVSEPATSSQKPTILIDKSKIKSKTKSES